jgi:MFS family permease
MTAVNTPRIEKASQSPRRAPASPEPANDLKVVATIGVAHFYSHLFILLLPPLFPLIRDDLQVSYLELGFILTGFAVTSAVSQLPIGFLVDRFGARKILIIGLVVESLCFVLMGFWSDYWVLFAAYLVAGIANGVYHPADYAILSASVRPERMGRAFSLHTFSGYLGFAVAPFTIILLAETFGWQTGLAIIGASGLLAAAALVYYRDYLREARKAPQSVDKKASSQAAWKLLTSTPVLVCFAFFAMLALLSNGINNFSVAGLNLLYGIDLVIANTALTIYLAFTAGGILLGGYIADRTHRHNLVAASCFLVTSILMFIIAVMALPAMLLITLFAIQGTMHGLIMPSRDMMVRAVTPEGSMGKVFGFVSTGLNLGSVVGPIIFAYLLDIGAPQMVFFVISGLMLVSMTTVFTSIKTSR